MSMLFSPAEAITFDVQHRCGCLGGQESTIVSTSTATVAGKSSISSIGGKRSGNRVKSPRIEGSGPRLLDGGKSQIKNVFQKAGALTRWTLAQPVVAQPALPDL
uniref:Uncharacterized protein n=1 Tax=Tanacetum cinerariifolium TaxID=118510 RepID=A0A699JUG0_TANCI|nr:hypothetical protein [Tanacetum cinerariifolium]